MSTLAVLAKVMLVLSWKMVQCEAAGAHAKLLLGNLCETFVQVFQEIWVQLMIQGSTRLSVIHLIPCEGRYKVGRDHGSIPGSRNPLHQ
jgi:lysylphosphatidylglycerol synthetase-like protein (DUF2156 family)